MQTVCVCLLIGGGGTFHLIPQHKYIENRKIEHSKDLLVDFCNHFVELDHRQEILNRLVHIQQQHSVNEISVCVVDIRERDATRSSRSTPTTVGL